MAVSILECGLVESDCARKAGYKKSTSKNGRPGSSEFWRERKESQTANQGDDASLHRLSERPLNACTGTNNHSEIDNRPGLCTSAQKGSVLLFSNQHRGEGRVNPQGNESK